MTLEISPTPEAETRLRERAAAAGKQPADLARAIVEPRVLIAARQGSGHRLGFGRLVPRRLSVRRPTLQEISGPIYQEFLKNGMTDEELGDVLEEAKHAMRAEKQGERKQ